MQQHNRKTVFFNSTEDENLRSNQRELYRDFIERQIY